MAKNPKFLKNLLTTASALSLVAFSANSAMGAAAARTITATPSTGAGVGMDGGGGVAITAGSTVKFMIASAFTGQAVNIGAIDINGLGGSTWAPGANNKSIGSIVNTGAAVAAANRLALDVRAGQTTTLTGAAVPVALAGAGGFVAGPNDYSGLGNVTLDTGSTLAFTLVAGGPQAVLDGTINSVAAGDGNIALDANSNVLFNGAIGTTRGIRNFVLTGTARATLGANTRLDGTVGNGAITLGDGAVLTVKNGVNIVGTAGGNQTTIDGSAKSKGTLKFEGTSAVNISHGIGTNQQLAAIEIGDGAVTFAGATANNIKAAEIRLTHANAILRTSTVNAAIEGKIIPTTPGTGKVEVGIRTDLLAGSAIGAADNRVKNVDFTHDVVLNVADGVNIYTTDGITASGGVGFGDIATAGDTVIAGRVGGILGIGNKMGDITAVGAGKTLTLLDDVNASDIIIDPTTTVVFKGNVTSAVIKGAGANNGIVTFANAAAIKVDSNMGHGNGLTKVNISGADVEVTKGFRPFNLAFTEAGSTTTLNLTGTAADLANLSNVIITSKSDKVTLGISGDTTFDVDVGTDAEKFGTIKLLQPATSTITVKTANFFASIATATAHKGKAAFNLAAGTRVQNIGSVDKPFEEVTFTENNTVYGDSFADNLIIANGKEGTFHKIVGGGKVTLTQVATATFEDGSTLLSTLEPTTDKQAIANFKGSTIIAQGVGAKNTSLAELNFLDNSGNKGAAVAGDIYAADVDFKKYNVLAIGDTIFHGIITSENTTYHADVYNIKLVDGQTSTFTGELSFGSSYDGSVNGKFIVDGKNTVADFTGATKINLFLDDDSQVRPAVNGVTLTILGDTNGGAFKGLDYAKVKGTPPTSNRFVQWTYNNNGSFSGIDITDKVGKQILNGKGASSRAQENFASLISRDNTLDAAAYGNELYNLGKNAATEGDFVESIERFTNPSTAQASQAVSEAVSEAGSIVTSRMQTLASPQPLQVTSASDVGVAAGEQDGARYGVWGSPFYNQGIQKVRKGVSGYRSKTYGGTVGFDTMANDTMIVGLAATVVRTDLKHKNTNSGDKTKANTVMFSIYGLQQINEDWFLQGVANFGSTRVKNSAGRVGYANGSVVKQTANAKYDSMSWGGEVMAGYTWKMSDMAALTPMIGLDYTRISDSGYTETGTTSQNQIVSKKSMDKINAVVGIRGVMASTDYSGITITPEAHAFVRQALGNKKAKMDIKLNGLATPLTTLNVKPAKTFYNVGLGLNGQSGMYDFGVTYDAHLANKYVGHQGTLKVRVNF